MGIRLSAAGIARLQSASPRLGASSIREKITALFQGKAPQFVILLVLKI
jgi:hypothetical protein